MHDICAAVGQNFDNVKDTNWLRVAVMLQLAEDAKAAKEWTRRKKLVTCSAG